MKKENDGRVVDDQSLADTHEMIQIALSGQSYVLETMHRTSTTQVTGEALKRISVGGKGGFGSQGDARDQESQVDATTRVMVMSDPSQEAFDHNASLKEVVVGWDDTGKAIYADVVRDYDDFSHLNSLDASDNMRSLEYLGLPKEELNKARELYNELCGYKDAWKFLGIDGAEHRRYRISVQNTLNLLPLYPPKEGLYVPKTGWHWYQEMSHRAHNNQGATWSEDLKGKDTIQYMMWQFDQMKPYVEQEIVMREAPIIEPSKAFLKAKEKAEYYDRKRRLEAMLCTPKEVFKDLKLVYKWELTKNGKTMFN